MANHLLHRHDHGNDDRRLVGRERRRGLMIKSVSLLAVLAALTAMTGYNSGILLNSLEGGEGGSDKMLFKTYFQLNGFSDPLFKKLLTDNYHRALDEYKFARSAEAGESMASSLWSSVLGRCKSDECGESRRRLESARHAIVERSRQERHAILEARRAAAGERRRFSHMTPEEKIPIRVAQHVEQRGVAKEHVLALMKQRKAERDAEHAKAIDEARAVVGLGPFKSYGEKHARNAKALRVAERLGLIIGVSNDGEAAADPEMEPITFDDLRDAAMAADTAANINADVRDPAFVNILPQDVDNYESTVDVGTEPQMMPETETVTEESTIPMSDSDVDNYQSTVDVGTEPQMMPEMETVTEESIIPMSDSGVDNYQRTFDDLRDAAMAADTAANIHTDVRDPAFVNILPQEEVETSEEEDEEEEEGREDDRRSSQSLRQQQKDDRKKKRARARSDDNDNDEDDEAIYLDKSQANSAAAADAEDLEWAEDMFDPTSTSQAAVTSDANEEVAVTAIDGSDVTDGAFSNNDFNTESNNAKSSHDWKTSPEDWKQPKEEEDVFAFAVTEGLPSADDDVESAATSITGWCGMSLSLMVSVVTSAIVYTFAA